MFAIVLLQLWDSHVHVHTAVQYLRPHEDDAIDMIMKLLEGTDYRANVYVDGANQSFIRKLKSMVKDAVADRCGHAIGLFEKTQSSRQRRY